MDKKYKYLLGIIIILGLMLIVGTYAWLSYRSNDTAMVLTIGDLNNVKVTLSPYQIKANIVPKLTYEGQKEYTSIEAVNNSSSERNIILFFNIDEIDASLKNSNFKYTMLKSTDGINYSEYSSGSGNFSNAVAGTNLNILNEAIPGGGTTYYYRVYIWLYGEDTGQSGIQGKTFKGELRAEILYNSNAPSLDDGLIPVTIADNGSVTVVSKNDSNWYNYSEKKWANAVLVKESGVKTRAQNKVVGTVINPNDILAYFVWIPRYSYKVWSLTAEAKTGQEQLIEIKFVDKSVKENATKVGDWYTHPAFSFGGTELDGIWVGKFETGMDETSACYANRNASSCNNNNVDPRVVPNDYSLRYQNISNQFQTALKFAGGSMINDIVTFAGSNKYGLTVLSDSHMASNTEWGVVAYLSHSKYGIGNVNVRINNRTNAYKATGCGASTDGGESTTECQIPYGSGREDYPQSTTGNISGVFDMSGGAWEYTMANLGENSGKSGLSPEWFTINSKYVDIYDATIFNGSMAANLEQCTFALCGGQAIGETHRWHNNIIASFYTLESHASTGYTGYWGTRGGGYGNDTSCGIFKVVVDRNVDANGTANGGISFRTILVVYN